jgi:hypothetical protein
MGAVTQGNPLPSRKQAMSLLVVSLSERAADKRPRTAMEGLPEIGRDWFCILAHGLSKHRKMAGDLESDLDEQRPDTLIFCFPFSWGRLGWLFNHSQE